MLNMKEILAEIFNCTESEIDMLMQTNINIGTTVQCITENGYELTISQLYQVAFENSLYDLEELEEFDRNDFELNYNGTQDTHIYIKESKVSYYYSKAPETMNDIEDTFDMEFEKIVE